MSKLFGCVYCKSPSVLREEGNKTYLDCPKCGEQEITDKLKNLKSKGFGSND